MAALLLGSIGFFSLLDHAVQHRTREIGIRRALGAHTWDVVRSLVEPTARPLMRGLLIGTAGGDSRAALMIAAVFASYAPTRRALRIAPAAALRVDR